MVLMLHVWLKLQCMLQFRSISYGLFGTEAYHKAVRRKAVQYMRDHRSDFEAFLGDDMDGWLKEMSQHESWGDELTLVSASIMLWCPCPYLLHTCMSDCQLHSEQTPFAISATIPTSKATPLPWTKLGTAMMY